MNNNAFYLFKICNNKSKKEKGLGNMLTKGKKVSNRQKIMTMVMCGSLRIFWHVRPVLSGAAGRRDVGEIQVFLEYEAKWV